MGRVAGRADALDPAPPPVAPASQPPFAGPSATDHQNRDRPTQPRKVDCQKQKAGRQQPKSKYGQEPQQPARSQKHRKRKADRKPAFAAKMRQRPAQVRDQAFQGMELPMKPAFSPRHSRMPPIAARCPNNATALRRSAIPLFPTPFPASDGATRADDQCRDRTPQARQIDRQQKKAQRQHPDTKDRQERDQSTRNQEQRKRKADKPPTIASQA